MAGACTPLLPAFLTRCAVRPAFLTHPCVRTGLPTFLGHPHSRSLSRLPLSRLPICGLKTEKNRFKRWLSKEHTKEEIPALRELLDILPMLRDSHGRPFRPLVLVGPSGVGKSFLLRSLRAIRPDEVDIAVTHTSRKPRYGEVDGEHYHFVSEEKMKNMLTQGELLEMDKVHGNLYGTSVDSIIKIHKTKKICAMDMSIQGAQDLAESCAIWQNRLGFGDPYCVFIEPPHIEEVERRLRHRGTESEEKILLRLENAKKELEIGRSKSLWNKIITYHW